MIHGKEIQMLVEFLHSHHDCAKFIQSVVDGYKELQDLPKPKHLSTDSISIFTYNLLIQNLVVSQQDLCLKLHLNSDEIHKRINFIESQLREKISVDRTNPDIWIIYLNLEVF